jgi:RNA polymerase sigma-70 factor (ECF subfamily)
MPAIFHTTAASDVLPMMRDDHPLSPREALGMVRPAAGEEARPSRAEAPASDAARLRQLVDAHYDTVWRTVRFLGIQEANAEDVAQQAFAVIARRLGDVPPGAERSFVLATAWRLASEHRRASRRRPPAVGEDVDRLVAEAPSPEQLLDQKRARAMLHDILAAMPENLRIVFVLHEIEELTLPEIAAAIGRPLGTATSRLRRAREEFHAVIKRIETAASTARRRAR